MMSNSVFVITKVSPKAHKKSGQQENKKSLLTCKYKIAKILKTIYLNKNKNLINISLFKRNKSQLNL